MLPRSARGLDLLWGFVFWVVLVVATVGLIEWLTRGVPVEMFRPVRLTVEGL